MKLKKVHAFKSKGLYLAYRQVHHERRAHPASRHRLIISQPIGVQDPENNFQLLTSVDYQDIPKAP